MESTPLGEPELKTSELSANLSEYDQIIADYIRKFCKRRKFESIVSNIQLFFETNSDLNIAYISLRPDNNEYSSLNRFVGFTQTNPEIKENSVEIAYHRDGIELSVAVKDCLAASGKLNLGLYHTGCQFDLLSKIRKIIAAFEIELQQNNDDANSSQDDFMARLIHKIRNPLATILIAASQISAKTDNVLDEDDRMLLEYINTEAERIEEILADLSSGLSTRMARSGPVQSVTFKRKSEYKI